MGIDPGTKGAIVVLKESGEVVDSIRFDKATDTEAAGFLEEYASGIHMAVIEKVHSMPGQGVASTFKFGEAYGKVQGMLISMGIAYDFCTPRKWQKAVGIQKKDKYESGVDFKNRLKEASQRMFPDEKIVLANADAFLIAEYCRRMYRSFL